MEEQLEKIRLEYELYDVEDVNSIDDLLSYLFDCLVETEYYREFIEASKSKNITRRKAVKLLGRLSKYIFTCSDNLEYFDADDRLLDRQGEILDKFYGQLEQLNEKMSEDNFQDIYRLASFAASKYLSNNNSVHEERIMSLQRYNGKKVSGILSVDDSEVFDIFFNEALNMISLGEKIEKVKK